MALLLVSVNVDGLRDQTKRAGFMHWLHSLPFVPDVVCLQEAHCTSPSECESWFRSSGFSVVASSGSSRSCGCIVLFRPMLSLVKSSSDNCGRFLLCEFSLRGVLRSGLLAFMLLIATLTVTLSSTMSPPVWTRRFPPCL